MRRELTGSGGTRYVKTQPIGGKIQEAGSLNRGLAGQRPLIRADSILPRMSPLQVQDVLWYLAYGGF